VLQLMAESVAEMVGFEVTALSVVIDDELVTVAYVGPEEFRSYVEEPDPRDVLDPVLARAERWGPRLRFLAAADHGELEGHWVRFDQETVDHPEAWNPDDVLLAVLSDDAGEMVGAISVDRPVSRMRPDARVRDLLERYAAQAERAVLTAREREELVQQVAHAESARRLIRAASMPAHSSLEDLLRSTHLPLVEGFAARGSWIHVLDTDSPGGSYARQYDGETVVLSADVVEEARRIAPRLWRDESVLVVVAGETPGLPDAVHRQLQELGLSSLLAVALGAGEECLGFLALTRSDQDPPWSQVEIDSARQIGYDLGAALMTARALERERALVRELQQLDDYRSQLIATMSHELRTPLTVISGNLELLDDLGLEMESAAAGLYAAMSRGTERMKKVVDDVLLLALVGNPQHPLVPVPVDLRQVAADVIAATRADAGTKRLTLHAVLDSTDVVVPGDPAELHRLVGNLVSNAVKYTPEGGTVTVSVTPGPDEVQLRVSDDGLGISEQDQVGLFGAFFRTTNPDALAQPGAGLGLTIVATIVERHEGAVTVTSRLGEGTEFTVTLPLTHDRRQNAVDPGFTTPRRAATRTNVQIA
jgi:signal transduction histidine kinase